MRAINVTFRAIFQQPIGQLNPMGAKVPGLLAVELFLSGASWVARSLGVNGSRGAVYNKLGRFVSLEHAKATVEAAFAECLQPWEMRGARPDGCGTELPLTPYEVADLGEGKYGWIQDEDRTHIIHAPTIPPGAKIPPAACGAQVNAKCFISAIANIKPTCRGCEEIWRKEYKGK